MNNDYHSGIESVSSTGLKMLLQKSPKHYLEAYTWERPEPTKAQLFGIAAHLLILEGQGEFNKHFVEERLAPDVNRRTKAGKAEYQQWLDDVAKGRPVISAKDFHAMERMKTAFELHPEVRKMKDHKLGDTEKEIMWRDPITGTLCKCKPDWLAADNSYAIDLKTCDSAHPDDVSRAIRRYMYHLSAAFYLQGIEAARLEIPQWRWVFVEKKEPYAVAVYKPSPQLIDDGDKLVSRALDIHRTCTRSGSWNDGYGLEAMEIDIWRAS